VFHLCFWNNTAYHDVHHQLRGSRFNFSTPFFVMWDKVFGTYMPYVVEERPGGGLQARPLTAKATHNGGKYSGTRNLLIRDGFFVMVSKNVTNRTQSLTIQYVELWISGRSPIPVPIYNQPRKPNTPTDPLRPPSLLCPSIGRRLPRPQTIAVVAA
jgi:hypothetical protein